MTQTLARSGWLERLFEVSHGKGRQLRSMEGLRGLAVFLVFLVHYVTLAKPWLAPASFSTRVADGLHNIGNTGVDLFFVLSGYLIYGSLIRKPYIRQQWTRLSGVLLEAASLAGEHELLVLPDSWSRVENCLRHHVTGCSWPRRLGNRVLVAAAAYVHADAACGCAVICRC